MKCLHCDEDTDAPGHSYTYLEKGKVREMCRRYSQDKRSEKAIQAEIVRNLRSLGFFVSTFSQAQRAQMTAGIPDVVAMHRTWKVKVWIEVKRPTRRNEKGGGCTCEQLQWHANARECGENVVVAYGWADVLTELRRLGCPIV